MLSADPQIAWPRDRIDRRLGRRIGVFILLRRAVEQAIEFSLVETKQAEVDILIAERSQLGRQHLVIPARVVGDTVVGDHQRATLRGGKVRKHDDRRLRETKLARRQHTPMSRNDHAIVADQHRVHETKLRNRASDLRDLGLGMRPGIARMRDQPIEWPMFEVGRKHGCHVDFWMLRWGIEPRYRAMRLALERERTVKNTIGFVCSTLTCLTLAIANSGVADAQTPNAGSPTASKPDPVPVWAYPWDPDFKPPPVDDAPHRLRGQCG